LGKEGRMGVKVYEVKDRKWVKLSELAEEVGREPNELIEAFFDLFLHGPNYPFELTKDFQEIIRLITPWGLTEKWNSKTQNFCHEMLFGSKDEFQKFLNKGGLYVSADWAKEVERLCKLGVYFIQAILHHHPEDLEKKEECPVCKQALRVEFLGTRSGWAAIMGYKKDGTLVKAEEEEDN